VNFLNPGLALAGLACIALPIIIHLLVHRRRRPIRWGAMRFLQEAFRRQQRRIRLEKWLLLAARCLLVALIAIALGKPLLGGSLARQPGRTVFVLIDNSLTSSASLAGETALDLNKRFAKSVIDQLRVSSTGGSAHRVGLIALASPSQKLVLPPTSDIASVRALIEQLAPADSRADLPGALALVQSAIAASSGADDAAPDTSTGRAAPINPAFTDIVIASEFRDGSLALSSSTGGLQLATGVRIIAPEPASGPALDNIGIVDIEPARSVLVTGADGQASQFVRVRLKRDAGTGREQLTRVSASLERLDLAPAPVSVSRASASRPVASDPAVVRWSPGQESAVAVVPIEGGMSGSAGSRSSDPAARTRDTATQIVRASIDQDAIAGDNAFRKPIDIRDALRVGIIAPTRFGQSIGADRLDSGAWLRLALNPAGAAASSAAVGIDVIDIEPDVVDAGRLAGLDALLVPRPDIMPRAAWPRVSAFADGGGLVLITPPTGLTVHAWTDDMTRGLGGDWSLARETRLIDPTRPVALQRSASLDGEVSSDALLTRARSSASLLALIDSELDELVRAVRLLKILPVDRASSEPTDTLLELSDGTPVLSILASRSTGGTPPPRSSASSSSVQSSGPAAGSDRRGLVLYLGVAPDLDWTDLPAKPLMLPLMQELVRQGVGHARGGWIARAGEPLALPARTSELKPTGSIRDGPILRVGDATPVVLASAGVYRAVDDQGAIRGVVSVNADARAGGTVPQPRESIANWLRSVQTLEPDAGDGGRAGADEPRAGSARSGGVVWLRTDGRPAVDAASLPSNSADPASSGELFATSSKGTPVWWPLLVGALVLALIECALARWASHANIQGAGAISPAGLRSSLGVSAASPGGAA
jgi:Aerotolerance regulator N-terminal/von Willebrand factor type A domain